MCKTIKCALTAGLFLLLSGFGYSVLADDGQLSSWEDSRLLDYPPPPVGGWEPLVPIYNPADNESAEAEKENRQTTNSANQSAKTPAPEQYAPRAGTAPPAASTYPAPVAPGYAPVWPPAVAPGYNPGYVRPGYNPGFNRPAYPARGFGGPGRGYVAPVYNTPAYNIPGTGGQPGNYGNPWNNGNPGGWGATPWGELGPAGWIYPDQNATQTAPDSAQPAPNPDSTEPAPELNMQDLSGMSGGFNAPLKDVSRPSDTADQFDNTAPAQVTGFSWNVRD